MLYVPQSIKSIITMRKYRAGLYIAFTTATSYAFHTNIFRHYDELNRPRANWKRRRVTSSTSQLLSTASPIQTTSISDVLKLGRIRTDPITNRSDRIWLMRYEELMRYKDEYGDCLVPAGFQKNKSLANWVQFQRAQWKKKTAFKDSYITEERIELLEAIDFVFEPNQMVWDIYFKSLVSFKQEHGDCSVPQNYEENPSLGTWVNMQRVYYNNFVKSGNRISITEQRIRKLDSIGFCWNLHQNSWSKRFHELESYQKKHGNCLVSPDYNANPSLGLWVVNQRHLYKNLMSGEKPSITQDRVNKLKSIGFCFDLLEIQWVEKFDELKEYKQTYGTFQVNSRKDPSLALWVSNLRSAYKKRQAGIESSLSEDRINMLDDIGFVWNYNVSIQIGFDIRKKEWIQQKTKQIRRRKKPSKHNESLWLKRFRELQLYKEKYGNCQVSKGYDQNPSLGNWVNANRVQYKRMICRKESQITLERIKKLQEIGFIFDLQEEAWNTKYKLLMQYCKEHNDCLVRQTDEENKELGKWVANMRAAYKKISAGKRSQLNQERVDKLNAVGFVWNARAIRTENQT